MDRKLAIKAPISVERRSFSVSAWKRIGRWLDIAEVRLRLVDSREIIPAISCFGPQ
jgi:hypothetical protein